MKRMALLALIALGVSGCYTQLKRTPPRAELEPTGIGQRDAPEPEPHPRIAHNNRVFLSIGEPVDFAGTLISLDRVRDNRALVDRVFEDGAETAVGSEIIGEATMYLTAILPGGGVEKIRFDTAARPSEQVITLTNGLTMRPVSLEPIREFTGPPIADNQYMLEIVLGY
jgi:hypothetical protein